VLAGRLPDALARPAADLLDRIGARAERNGAAA
jgi:hypothetical protein